MADIVATGHAVGNGLTANLTWEADAGDEVYVAITSDTTVDVAEGWRAVGNPAWGSGLEHLMAVQTTRLAEASTGGSFMLGASVDWVATWVVVRGVAETAQASYDDGYLYVQGRADAATSATFPALDEAGPAAEPSLMLYFAAALAAAGTGVEVEADGWSPDASHAAPADADEQALSVLAVALPDGGEPPSRAVALSTDASTDWGLVAVAVPTVPQASAGDQTQILVGSVPWTRTMDLSQVEILAQTGVKSVLLRYTAAGDGTMRANTFGTGGDTVLQVWDGALENLLAENDDAVIPAARFPGDPAQWGQGKVLWGASAGTDPGPEHEVFGTPPGPLALHRIYFQSDDSPATIAAAVQADVNKGRVCWFSWKPSGAGYAGADAAAEAALCLDLANRLADVVFPPSHPLAGQPAPVWWTNWHEPENDGGTPAQFGVASQRVQTAIATSGATNIAHVDVLMSYTLLDGSGRPWEDWIAACKGDVIAFDYYAKATDTAGDYHSLFDERLATVTTRIATAGKPVAIGEFAVTQYLYDADPGAWHGELEDFADYIEAQGWVGACYFDSPGNSSDLNARPWLLSDSQRSWYASQIRSRSSAASTADEPLSDTSSTESEVTYAVSEGTAYVIIAGHKDETASEIVVNVNGPAADGGDDGDYPGGWRPPLPPLAEDDGVPLWRVNHVWPDPVWDDDAKRIVPHDRPTSTTRTRIGTLHLIVSGQDVTYFRGGQCLADSWSAAEPFGEETAQFTVSHLQLNDSPASGDLLWLYDGASVDVVLRSLAGENTVLWTGQVTSFEPSVGEEDWSWSVQCQGALRYADGQVYKPATFMDPTDLGTVISRDLNAVVSHPYDSVAAVATGILTTARGTGGQSVLEDVQERLATMTTDDGTNQWTIARSGPRHYVLRLKDRATEHWSVSAMEPGVSVQLSRDFSEVVNCFYGRGVGPNGYGWGNWVYPMAAASSYKPYCLPTSPLQTMKVGYDDGDTIGGHGVSDVQRRLNELGISAKVRVDGVYNTNDAEAVRTVQRHYGILVDGIVGPQTWSALFPQYVTSSLMGAFRLPLAVDTRVVPRLYNADGTDAGANPAYEANLPRREVDIDYGSGVTKTEGRRDALARLARDGSPAWVGSITLSMDPGSGSFLDVREGQNIRLRDWVGEPLLHIARVTVNPSSLSVTLDVDEKARDLATLLAIRDRNRAALINPARLPANRKQRRTAQERALTPFDGESPGGKIRRTALIPGLWVMLAVPVSEAGLVARVELRTSPAAKFCVAFWGDLGVTANWIAAKVGDPFVSTNGYGPFDKNRDDLIEMGFIQAIGGPSQAAGYDPGYETSPYNGQSTVLTGKLYADGQWSYQSSRPPFLLLSFWTDRGCTIEGQILPAPVE